MRIYEELFIVKPDAPEEEIDQFIEQMKGIVTAANGSVDKAEKWGKRRLAYRVDKYRGRRVRAVPIQRRARNGEGV